MDRALGHLRGNLIAYLALFVALSGSAYAAIKIERNAVRSKQIKDGSVRARDLRNDSVNTSKVANGSLLGEDFASGQLPEGPQGPQGPQGQRGLAGQDATKLFAYIRDSGDAGSTASIQYGSGVSAVTDPAGGSIYIVTFDRSLQNCVIDAIPGFGDPGGSSSFYTGLAMPSINLSAGSPSQAEVGFTYSGPQIDTSFMISAFC